MNLSTAIEHLAAQCQAVAALVADVGPGQVRWKPAPDQWSILEVVNHLADEEREDFRTRVGLALFAPTSEWPPIDPQGWVAARRYNERDFQPSLADYRAEREQSLAWLRGLEAPNWDSRVERPWGVITAGDLLAAWVAHDVLHLRQLVELRYAYLVEEAQPDSVVYAGEW